MRIRRPIARLALASGLLVLAACGGDQADVSPGPDGAEEIDVDRLRSLPYASSVAGSAGSEEKGVVFHDSETAWQGVSLYASRPLCLAELIDMEGRVLRSWREPGCVFWENAELLDDGGVLVVGADSRSDEGRFLKRFDAQGELVWRHAIALHHDMERDPGGGVLSLEARHRMIPEIHPELSVRDDYITLVSESGEALSRVSILDALLALEDLSELETVAPKKKWGRHFIDFIHANSVERMTRAALFGSHEFYDSQHVIVCSRHQNRVAIIDLESGQAVWSWGSSELDGPHDAQLLENGRILIFDNGMARGWSRVLEVDPRSDQIAWEYPGEDDPPFYTSSRGAVQRLPNGNTLVTNSNSGEVFEVTPDGRYAWHFFNPNEDEKGERTTLFRMRRYPPDVLE
jgi:hypothetical protein